MEPIIETLPNGIRFVNNSSAVDELQTNNCTMPNIKRIIFNLGKKAYPKRDENNKILKDKDGKLVYGPEVDVLATTVYFVDNTKVTVLNSVHDGLNLEDKVLSNGNTIKVATFESKERGIVYAIVKRIVSKPTEDGKMANGNLGNILKKFVENGYDENVEREETKISKAKAKAAYLEAKNNPKSKKQKYSIAGTLSRINDLLDKVESNEGNSISLIDSLKTALKSFAAK